MIKEFEEIIEKPEYNFLRDNKLLGDNIILLGLGGSHAYGTNVKGSDVDIRGIATNTKRNILTGNCFEQVVNEATDTTIYSLEKIIKLLTSCNPNTIEMLGLKPEHYLQITPAGKMLLDNKNLFLSKAAAHSFGGYANAQLYRLQNKSARLLDQKELEEHILRTIQNASIDFKRKYFEFPEDAIKLYVDNSETELYDSEIFLDINLHHYPLRDYKGMLGEMGEIIKSYSKVGMRNQKAIEKNKLGKHMMHLVRLYYMCFDILENGEIITFREKEHDFLMNIRNGMYLDENKQPVPEFFEIVKNLEERLEYDKKNTELSDKPNVKEIENLLYEINSEILKEN